jgi:hypothetical protein
MASDFLVAWQCLSKRTIGFLLRNKLHAIDQSCLLVFLTKIYGHKNGHM